jgi:hypothetical protein
VSSAIAQDPIVEQMKQMLDAGMHRLDGDFDRLSAGLHRLAGTTAIAAPPDAVRAVALARVHVVGLRKQLEAFETDHPAKPKLLAGLGLAADGLAAMRLALAATTAADIQRYERVARDRFTRAGRGLLAADRAMGCVYGCWTAPISKPRRAP